jgi:hypothetical protein
MIPANLVQLRRFSSSALRTYRESGSATRALRHAGWLIGRRLRLLVAQVRVFRRRRQAERSLAVARLANRAARPIIGVKVTGGVGDFIVIARFLRDLLAHEDIIIDIYASAPAVARWVFAAVPGFRDVFAEVLFEYMVAEYDLGLTANQFVVVQGDRANWHRLRGAPDLMQSCGRIVRYREKIEVLVQHHPHMDNVLARRAVFSNATRRDYLHHIAGIVYGGDGLDVPFDADALARLGLAGRRYITVHNGFDAGFPVNGARATKCYPHFPLVVAEIRRVFPDLRIVQIGTSTMKAASCISRAATA